MFGESFRGNGFPILEYFWGKGFPILEFLGKRFPILNFLGEGVSNLRMSFWDSEKGLVVGTHVE